MNSKHVFRTFDTTCSVILDPTETSVRNKKRELLGLCVDASAKTNHCQLCKTSTIVLVIDKKISIRARLVPSDPDTVATHPIPRIAVFWPGRAETQ